jgi:hypothetical protein
MPRQPSRNDGLLKLRRAGSLELYDQLAQFARSRQPNNSMIGLPVVKAREMPLAS